MVDQLSQFSSEVTRVAREVGTDGILGGKAEVRDVSGVWQELTSNVNGMADNLTNQVRNIATVATAAVTSQPIALILKPYAEPLSPINCSAERLVNNNEPAMKGALNPLPAKKYPSLLSVECRDWR